MVYLEKTFSTSQTRNSIIFEIDIADSYIIYDIICIDISLDSF